jgi:hypothetical protein
LHHANNCREGPNSPPLTLHQNQDIPPKSMNKKHIIDSQISI